MCTCFHSCEHKNDRISVFLRTACYLLCVDDLIESRWPSVVSHFRHLIVYYMASREWVEAQAVSKLFAKNQLNLPRLDVAECTFLRSMQVPRYLFYPTHQSLQRNSMFFFPLQTSVHGHGVPGHVRHQKVGHVLPQCLPPSQERRSYCKCGESRIQAWAVASVDAELRGLHN